MPLDIDSTLYFPNNAVKVIAQQFQALDERLTVILRPINSRDVHLTVAVFAADLIDVSGTREVGAVGATLQRYGISVQSMIKDPNEERALNASSVVSTAIRSTLDSSPAMRLALGGLVASLPGVTSRLKRWEILSTRYLNNNLEGTNVYLAMIDLYIEVERSSA